MPTREVGISPPLPSSRADIGTAAGRYPPPGPLDPFPMPEPLSHKEDLARHLDAASHGGRQRCR